MKTKLFTLLLIFASIAYEASAYKIIIRGGTSDHKFYEVIVSNSMTKCTGRGTNLCPVKLGDTMSLSKIAGIPMSDIVKYVFNQLKDGRTEGQVNYENRLPCSWKRVGENVEIDIQSDDATGLQTTE